MTREQILKARDELSEALNISNDLCEKNGFPVKVNGISPVNAARILSLIEAALFDLPAELVHMVRDPVKRHLTRVTVLDHETGARESFYRAPEKE